MLYSLVYTSQNTRPFSHQALLALLDKARVTNTALGVTGMLLYKDGAFIQALEGEQATVTDLSERISRDPRHHAYFVCNQQKIDKRQFPDWSMGFRDLNSADAIADQPGYSQFMNQPLTKEAIDRDPSIVNKLLLMFRN